MKDVVDGAFASFHGLRREAFIRRKLPPDVIESVERLIGAFSSADPKGREEIVNRVKEPFRFVFESYAFYSAAQESIRLNEPSLVKRGLIALAIQNATPDWRDSLPFLAVLYRSASKLNLDAPRLFHEIAQISCPAFSRLIEGFVSHDGGVPTIESFRLKEAGEGDTFAYEFIPPPGLKIAGEGETFKWEFVPPHPRLSKMKLRWGIFLRRLRNMFPGIFNR